MHIKVTAPAKVNLSLDVTGSRPDGYHLLSTIMQSIDLADQIEVDVTDIPEADGKCEGPVIRLLCNHRDVPLDHRNTAYRAAERFLATAGLSLDTRIQIDKRIPLSAGLAGGSADAAAVLFALDRLIPGRIGQATLFKLAAEIGADVPFCLQGGTALCEGIGDWITPLPPFAGVPLLLCKPRFGISTRWVFDQYDAREADLSYKRPVQVRVINALETRCLPELADATANVLETISLPTYPILGEIKDRLLAAGASVALMSGSGPTVYGIFADAAKRDKARADLAVSMRENPDYSLERAGVRIYSVNSLATGPQTV